MKIDKRRIATITLLAIAATMAVAAVPRLVAGGNGSSGEVWVTAQASSQILILHPRDVLEGAPFETLQLPSNAHPHITTFSPDGNFAYVSDMGNGQLTIIRAQDRQIITSLNIAPVLTHQAKASPDGTVLLVANIANKTLFRVAANETSLSWTVTGRLSFAPILAAPICSVFRDDGLRAYVSLLPSGIAILDVPTMTLLGTLPTDGFIACGMIKSQDGRTVFIASSGSGGHLYQLDTTTDTLFDTGHTIGAGSWHSFNVNPTETAGYGTSPAVNQLQVIDLASGASSPLILNPSAGVASDQPDAIAVDGNNVYVSLRFSGKLAVINAKSLAVQYLQLEPAASTVNPANCMGCAIHGVALRPISTTSTTVTTTSRSSINSLQLGGIKDHAGSTSGQSVNSVRHITLQHFASGFKTVSIQSLPTSGGCDGCCCCCGTVPAAARDQRNT